MECSDIIPYTSKTNKLYELETKEDYGNFSEAVMRSLEQCTFDPYMARWGACNMIHPRCLMGWELQFCRKSCLSMNHFKTFDIQLFSQVLRPVRFENFLEP